MPSLAFTPDVLSKYDIEKEEPPGTTTKFVLKHIGAVAVGMSAEDPLAVVGNGKDSDSSTHHTAKSFEQGEGSKGGGGNKSKTRRRQRQGRQGRQSKRNKMQRKNKYSRRRRSSKSKSK